LEIDRPYLSFLIMRHVLLVGRANCFLPSTPTPPADAMDVYAARKQMDVEDHSIGGPTRDQTKLHVPIGRRFASNDGPSEDVDHTSLVPAFPIKHDVVRERLGPPCGFTATKPAAYHLVSLRILRPEHSA